MVGEDYFAGNFFELWETDHRNRIRNRRSKNKTRTRARIRRSSRQLQRSRRRSKLELSKICEKEAATSRYLLRGGLFLDYFAGIFVFAKAEEDGLAEVVVAGPFGEAHLADQGGLDPFAEAHLGGADDAAAFGKVGEGSFVRADFLEAIVE